MFSKSANKKAPLPAFSCQQTSIRAHFKNFPFSLLKNFAIILHTFEFQQNANDDSLFSHFSTFYFENVKKIDTKIAKFHQLLLL